MIENHTRFLLLNRLDRLSGSGTDAGAGKGFQIGKACPEKTDTILNGNGVAVGIFGKIPAKVPDPVVEVALFPCEKGRKHRGITGSDFPEGKSPKSGVRVIPSKLIHKR